MAASTTMPTEKAMPARLITFRDRPNAAMATKAPTTETGIAKETTSVARIERKNSSNTMPASMPPTNMLFCTRSIAEFI